MHKKSENVDHYGAYISLQDVIEMVKSDQGEIIIPDSECAQGINFKTRAKELLSMMRQVHKDYAVAKEPNNNTDYYNQHLKQAIETFEHLLNKTNDGKLSLRALACISTVTTQECVSALGFESLQAEDPIFISYVGKLSPITESMVLCYIKLKRLAMDSLLDRNFDKDIELTKWLTSLFAYNPDTSPELRYYEMEPFTFYE